MDSSTAPAAEGQQQQRRGHGSYGSDGARLSGKAGADAGSLNSIDGLRLNFASLELAPLSLAEPHPLLSTASDADFDPDEFLCSRATGTKLNDVVAELEAHHDELQSHLLQLLQSHSHSFRELGAAVQEDAGAIDELGHVNSQLPPGVVALSRRQSDTRFARKNSSASQQQQPQQASLTHVRKVVEHTRDKLQSVKVEVDSVMAERKLCTQVQSHLSVLLALHQCILRLESLLGIPASSFERRRRASQRAMSTASSSRVPHSSAEDDELEADEDEEEDEADAILNGMGGLSGDSDQLARMEEYGMLGLGANGEEQDEGEEADIEADLLGLYSQAGEDVLRLLPQETLLGPNPLAALDPSLGSQSDPGLSAPQMSPRTRRKSLAPRRRSSAQSISMSQATAALWLPSPNDPSSAANNVSLTPLPEILPLPQRLAKAFDELSQIIALVRQALNEDLRPFVLARTRRLNGIGTALQADLNALSTQLLGPSSLIFRPLSRISARDAISLLWRDEDAGAESLQGWTQVDKEGVEEDSIVLKQRRDEQLAWLQLAMRTYSLLDGLLRCTSSFGSDTTSGASAALRDEFSQIVRRGALARWIHERIRSSPCTQLIKYSAEPGTAARAAREALDDRQAFPEPLESTPQIPALPSSAEGEPILAEDEADLGSSEALRKLYNEVLRFLAEDAQALFLAPASVSGAGVADDWQIDPFGTVWDEISRTLLEELGNVIFFVGRPNSFQQNYNLTARFLQLLARLVPSAVTLKDLHEHPGFIAFQKRWQLSVYFRIRLRAIISALEEGLSNGLLPVRQEHRAGQRETAQLQAAQSTYEAFTTPWRTSVHIRPLTAREWTLSLQIVSRFKTWLETEVLNEASASTDFAGSEQAAAANHGLEANGHGGHRRSPSGNSWKAGANATGRDSPKPGGRLGRVDSPAPDARQRAVQEAEDRRLVRWTWIASDVEWLEKSLWAAFDGPIVEAVRAALTVDMDGQVVSSVDGVLKEMKDALQNALSYRKGFVAVLGRNIVAILRQRCSNAFEVLNRAGSITRQYRTGASNAASGGSVPSQAFVSQMIAPLQDYFGTAAPSATSSSTAAALSRLDPEVRSAWAQDIVEDIVGRYATALFTMNKTLESLRRLKRGSTTLGFGSLFGGGSSTNSNAPAASTVSAAGNGDSDRNAAAAAASDPESVRTRRQMQADVAALESEIRAFEAVGVTVVLEGRDAWERLKRAAGGESEL
ncbi:hypothetical protein V8E36_000126 [Tilletia maclaganii]